MKKKHLRILGMGILVIVLIAVLPMGVHQFNLWRYPQKYKPFVEKWAAEYEVDPNILYAVIKTESSFDPQAESNVGARGLMQLTEETFEWAKLKSAPYEEIVFEDLYDPNTNIRFGSYFMDRCLERYEGDLATAAAAYHSGWGTVDKLLQDPAYSQDGKTLQHYPYPQMNRYVFKIQRNYNRYKNIYQES